MGFAGPSPIPQLLRATAKDAATSLVKAELRDSLKSVAFQGLERTFSDEAKQKKMRAELDRSKALPELLQQYLGVVESFPQALQIVLLLGQKASSVYFS